MSNPPAAQFDQYAHGYDEQLAKGLAVTGEGRDYFAEGRITFLSHLLRGAGFSPRRVIDFGCGTGAATPFLLRSLSPDVVLGLDVSPDTIAAARELHQDARAAFAVLAGDRPGDSVDLVYTNGVFHHIPPSERAAAVDFVWRSLRPGGIFAFWENNAWNPAARYVMSRIPFDRDAIPLSSWEARRLLRKGGFEPLRTDFLFIFPRALRSLRALERRLSRLPIGAQYQVLCRKP